MQQREGRVVHTLRRLLRGLRHQPGRPAYAEWKAGRLHTFKVGARRMVMADDAQAWLERCRSGDPESPSSRRAA